MFCNLSSSLVGSTDLFAARAGESAVYIFINKIVFTSDRVV